VKTLTFSSPGKILWIGSYTVVFGGISHSIAIDKRVRCSILGEVNGVRFHTSYGDFLPGQNKLIDSVISVIKEKVGDVKNLEISLINDTEFLIDGRKTGLGSSSAATVSLTACLYYYLTGKLDLNEIHYLSQKANIFRQRGIGSGFDIATAVYGSVVYRRFSDVERKDWSIEVTPIPEGYEMIMGFTGRSADTVNLVTEFTKIKEKPEFKEIFEMIEQENEMAVKYIKRKDMISAYPHIKLARSYLELVAKRTGFPLMSENEKRIIKESEKRGALIALSPGAGGGDSIFAIGECLNEVSTLWERIGIKVIKVKEDMGLKKDA